MNRNIFSLLLAGAMIFGGRPANGQQKICTITISDVKSTIPAPVSLDLGQYTNLPDSVLRLVRMEGDKRVPVGFQIENDMRRMLWWIIKNDGGARQQNQVFELLIDSSKNRPGAAKLRLSANDGKLTIAHGDKNILQYNFGTVYPPAGVDTVFKRSGFIHPLWSPGGNVLTRLSPPDHYHHFGLWNPWTKALYRGKIVDFWNLMEKQGTVQFARFIDKQAGPVFARFRALQEHVVFGGNGNEVAMNEQWNISAYDIGDNMWLVDFTSTLNCNTTEPVTLKEYRYAGFGFRATEDWNNKNSRILTSDGKTRKNSDGSRAKWCLIDGTVGQSASGIVFMAHPSNYNFPEPVRIWPEDMNGRGDVFFSFSPTKNMDWHLDTDKNHVLRYRMLIYDGTMTKERAEETWRSFAEPHKMVISK